MTAGDFAELIAYLFGAWGIGWCSGYVIAKFKQGMNQII